MVGIPVIDTAPMTVEEFYALTDTRPDDEKWELIEGEPILNASPSPPHQYILKNLIVALAAFEAGSNSAWVAIPGIGARISDISRPEPDVMIVPPLGRGLDPTKRDTTDAIVLFEIASPSTAKRDLTWKRSAYISLPKLTHYFVVAQDAVEVVVFARESGFIEQRLKGADSVVEIPALGVSLRLAEIYRDTGLL